MFSLLLAISGGQDWQLLVEPLAVIWPGYRVLFCFFVVFIVFGVLNVLTGVFLETALEGEDRDLIIQAHMLRMDQFVHEMQEIFAEIDTDQSGKLTWKKFQECL